MKSISKAEASADKQINPTTSNLKEKKINAVNRINKATNFL